MQRVRLPRDPVAVAFVNINIFDTGKMKQTHTLQHVQTGHWVGAAALSNMGFHVPTCSATSPATPLHILKCPEFDQLCQGVAVRIQSTQRGLDRADLWMNALDVAIPSIIYRPRSPNNQMAFVYDLIEHGESVLFKSLIDGKWLMSDGTRLLTTAVPNPQCYFRVYGF